MYLYDNGELVTRININQTTGCLILLDYDQIPGKESLRISP
jgi:hypothetical protein